MQVEFSKLAFDGGLDFGVGLRKLPPTSLTASIPVVDVSEELFFMSI